MVYIVFVVFELIVTSLLQQQNRAEYLRYLLANSLEVKRWYSFTFFLLGSPSRDGLFFYHQENLYI